MAKLHRLVLTDGTNSIDLLSKNKQWGWFLREATLNFPTFKGDGSWSDPVTASGRNISYFALNNPNDLYELQLKAHTSDQFNVELSDLRALLLQASNYWVDGIVAPVWLEARGINEGVTRYAIVKAGHLDGEGSHWHQPFFQPDCEPTMQFVLALERGMWSKFPPGDSECICTTSINRFDTILETRTNASINDMLLLSLDDWPAQITMLQSSFVFTLGLLFPPSDDTNRYWYWNRNGRVRIENKNGVISTKVFTDATDAEATFIIPDEYKGEWTYMDMVWNIGTKNITLFLDGVSISANTSITGTGTPVGSGDSELFRADSNLFDPPDVIKMPYPVEFLGINLGSTTPLSDSRVTTGDIACLFTEGAGVTLANSGTDTNQDIEYKTTGSVLWSSRQITDSIVMGKTSCIEECSETMIGGTSFPIPITHVFAFQGGVFSSNLMDSTPPYQILPSIPQAGDYLYVGSQVGRYTHITFNLNPAGASSFTEAGWDHWEVGRGAGVWVGFGSTGGYDTTRSLVVPGLGNVSGLPTPGIGITWDKDTVNGVLAFWWRLRIETDVFDLADWVSPVQSDYSIYSSNSFIDVPEFDGTTDALSSYDYKGASLALRQEDAFPTTFRIEKVACGFRSNSRGTDFVHDIPVRDEYLPPNITTGQFTSAAESPDAPGGWYVAGQGVPFTPENDTRFQVADWIIGSDVAKQYAGQYKMYARVSTGHNELPALGTTVGRLSAEIAMGADVGALQNTQVIETIVATEVITSDVSTTQWAEYFSVKEVGVIRIPSTSSYNSQSEITIRLWFNYEQTGAVTGDNLVVSDIMLIPADEYLYTSDGPQIGGIFGRIGMGTIINELGVTSVDAHTRKNLLIDSVSNPRNGTVSYEYIDDIFPVIAIPPTSTDKINDGITGTWQFRGAFPALLPNVDGGGKLFFAYPDTVPQTATQLSISVNPVYYTLGDIDD